MRRGRVAFLIRDLNIGGAQRQVIELAEGMQQHGWPVTVYTFYGGGGLERDLVARGVPLHVLGKRGRWDVIPFWLRLLRALRRERPAILHSYLATENILAVTMRPFLGGTRIVWGVRSSDFDLRQYGWLSRLLFAIESRLARFADLVVCNSAAGREDRASRGYPRRRMVVIPNGIDADRFRPDAEARAAVRAEWGVAPDELLLGIVARLDPKKDHVTFLRAAAAVVEARAGLRFVVVGDGPAERRDPLVRLASELGLDGHLTWAGARLDTPRVYNALDLLVSSSAWGEGFPNVIAEAMSSGVPCVVTDAGDSTLVVGDTGWICPAGDPGALARGALAAVADRDALRARGDLARRRIVEEFSVDRLVLTTAGHLAALLQPGARG